MQRNDGKYLENALQDELKKINIAAFEWRRLYDSFSAQGKALPPQPADFFMCYFGNSYHVECKTSKETNLRLKMFDQYGSMRRWGWVGVEGLVLVHFYTVDRLFLVPVKELESRPSWVMRPEWEISNIRDLITTIIGREECQI